MCVVDRGTVSLSCDVSYTRSTRPAFSVSSISSAMKGEKTQTHSVRLVQGHTFTLTSVILRLKVGQNGVAKGYLRRRKTNLRHSLEPFDTSIVFFAVSAVDNMGCTADIWSLVASANPLSVRAEGVGGDD